MNFKLNFDNRFYHQLPADPSEANSPRQVFNACYSKVKPTAVVAPKTIITALAVGETLGFNQADLLSQNFANAFSGNQLLDGMQPYAMCYGGHQFGHWAGQLGDGRAINLGEVVDVNNQHQTLQLKGAGLTPYSRTADGLAVLRSSVREFLCSEAMHYLGVPTTRALSLVLTGEQVMRDMLYDGNPALEPGAIVCRVAPSFIRFGSFQIFAARNDLDNLKRLVEFCIKNDFPELVNNQQKIDESIIEAWFEEVCKRTNTMIVEWMRVGFVHGVMNTDNMSILGLTIDYGPYGWLEGFDNNWTPNTTDAQGKRYAFGSQPQVAQWNLYQLANAIVPLLSSTDCLEKSLVNFFEHYQKNAQKMYAQKLGFKQYKPQAHDKMIKSMFELLESTEIDMTIFFRNLANISFENDPSDKDPKNGLDTIADAYYQFDSLSTHLKRQHNNWLNDYRQKLIDQGQQRELVTEQMNKANPKYVLRNYLAQIAIDKATNGDYSEIENLYQLLKKPYDEQPESQAYFAKRPEWARHKAGCSMLSCSS